MGAQPAVEAVGYLASALIVISVTRTSILKLRLLGLAGSVAFLGYGLAIGSYPIAVTNAVIVGIHLFYLRQLLFRPDECFRILEVGPDSPYLEDFLRFYRHEIARFQPEFDYVASVDQIRVFVLRDMVPAGLMIGRSHLDRSVEIELDFVVPQYRDFRVAEFLFSARSGVFAGVRTIWSPPGTELHNRYLRRLGFEQVERPDGDVVYQRAPG